METEIRGTADDSTRMMLGQIRQVFDPDWIQSFNDGDKLLIEFRKGTDAEPELARFAEMYGYELEQRPNFNWVRYRFTSE